MSMVGLCGSRDSIMKFISVHLGIDGQRGYKDMVRANDSEI